MVGVIYKITNLINGKIYIGKTSTSIHCRWKTHVKNAIQGGRHSRLYSAIRKHGASSFELLVIEEVFSNRMALNIRERFWINKFQSKNPIIGYNMTDGGDGGYISGVREKNRTLRLGTKMSEETKKKISMANAGRCPHPCTEEMKRKISASLKKIWANKEFYAHMSIINRGKALSGKNHPMFGKTHTTSARKSMSKSRKGRTWNAIYGKSQAEELRAKAREHMLGNTRARRKHE